MDRYTRKDAERAFERLCDALGKEQGHYRPKPGHGAEGPPGTWFETIPGGWALDYNPVYGGCVVEEIMSDGGTGVSHPLGSTRHTAREFCAMVNFAVRALELSRVDV